MLCHAYVFHLAVFAIGYFQIRISNKIIWFYFVQLEIQNHFDFRFSFCSFPRRNGNEIRKNALKPNMGKGFTHITSVTRSAEQLSMRRKFCLSSTWSACIFRLLLLLSFCTANTGQFTICSAVLSKTKSKSN